METMTKLETWPRDRLIENLKYFDKEFLVKHCEEIAAGSRKCFEERGGIFLGDPLPSLKCPALIIHGQKEVIVEELHALAMKSAFKNSRIHHSPQGGHDLHLSHTEEFVKLVENFLLE